MIEFIVGSSGTGKTTTMFQRIKEFSEKGMKQCVLVPEQYSTEFDKKLYFYIGAKNFNNIFSGSFNSIARQLFQDYGESDRNGEYADEMARMILIYQAISASRSDPDKLNFFMSRSKQTGFAEEVLKLITDMKHSGITPQKLMEKSVYLDRRLHDKTADISAIFFEYERLMKEYGFKDDLENIREASKIANRNRYFKGLNVCLDEFESFNGDQLDMLEVIFSSAANVIITLRTDDVNAGKFTLFETVNNTYRQLTALCRDINCEYRITRCDKTYRFKSPDLKYLSERIMRNIGDDPKNAPAAENIRIFEARDMYSEAEYICAEMKRLIFFDKTLRYSDIAVISNNIEQYADVLKSAYARYEIPYFLSVERQVNHTAIMVFFISLLDLLMSKKFRSEQIFRLLKCGILGKTLTEISELENYCYKWSIDGDTWNTPFTAEDSSLERVEKLRNDTIAPLLKLKRRLKGEIAAEEACRLLYNYFTESDAEKNMSMIMTQLIKEDRDFEAAELKRLWACLMDILDSTAETLGNKQITFRELADIMRSMIGRITYSVPPQTLDSVITASARTARLSAPKVIFVIGAAEGDFPNQVSLHGLFTEGDREKLSDQGIDIARPLTDLIASEQLIVYKSLSTASEKLYVTYSRSDLSGQVKYPARIIDNIQKMFGGGMLITDSSLSPDFYAVTMNSAYYHYLQDRSLNNSSTESIKQVLLLDDIYRERVKSVIPRSEKKLEYTVDAEIIRKLKNFEPLRISPTGLENYNKCHFMYFCSDFLNLQMPEKIDLDVRIAGDLTHNCFYSIMAARNKKEFETLSYEQLCKEIRNEAEKYRKDKMAGDFAKTPRFELLFNKLTEQLISVFMHTQQLLMASDFIPDAFELDLRKENSVRLNFGGDKELIFGGIIDRIDICEIDGKKYLRISDYKSSGKEISAETLAGGLNLQMLLYLFAASEENAVYGGYIPAGVLYSPVHLNDINTEESKKMSYNQSGIDSQLKTTGLIINDMDVLEAMEHGIGGRYIPAQAKVGGGLRKNSSVISYSGMDKLKKYVYKILVETAEFMYNGKIEAIPLAAAKGLACKYCRFSDICGNGDGLIYRDIDAEKLKEAEEILGGKE